MTTGKVVAISLVTSILVCAVFFLTWILLLDHPVGGPVSPVGAGIPASAVVPAPPGGALPEPAGGEVVVAPGGAPVVAPVPAAAPVPVVAPLSSPVAAGASVPAAPPAPIAAPPAGAAPVSGEAATASPVELLVPAVRGSSQARAEATLRAKGYRPVVRYAAYDEDVRPLAVTGQRPAAGTPLPAGSTVTIFVNPDGE